MGRASRTTEQEVAETLTRLRALWQLERDESRARTDMLRQQLSLPARVREGVALIDLHVADVDPAPGSRIVVWLAGGKSFDLDGFRGGPGDPVRLWWRDPMEPERVHGVISRRGPQRLAVVIEEASLDALDTPGFRLDLDDSQATFDRVERVLAKLAKDGGGPEWATARRVLLGGAEPDAPAPISTTPLDTGLDATQRAAVALALSAAPVALVHGPPGTGKTRTLVEVIRQIVARGERVLATGASNAAVDNLAARLAAHGVRLVRLGHPARIDPAVEAHTVDARVEASGERALVDQWLEEARALRRKMEKQWARGQLTGAERRELQKQARDLLRDARQYLERVQRAIVEAAPVVCATAAGADASWLRDQRFDWVVLDEATQSPDPMSLVALLRAPRAVLAGDPCQLPPTVLSAQAERGGLGTTLFERLAKRWPQWVALLRVQYRMHMNLMAFPNASLYGGALLAAPEVAHQQLEELPGVLADPLRPGPLVLVDTAGKGWDDERPEGDPSTRNPRAAARAAAEVRRILSRGVPAAHVALISPYDAQVRLYRELLGPERAQGLEVGTVDGFQGREKEVVVVDLVRSNGEGELGFLRDTRRMNVAITRAKRLLVVVADSATIGAHPYYQAFLDTAEAQGAHLSAWADDAPRLNE
jgi:superfamily I DNA and/or RNA helicase